MTTVVPSAAEASETPSEEHAAAEPPGPVPGRGLSVTLGTRLAVVADLMVLAALLAAYFGVKSGSTAWPPARVSADTYIPTVITVTAVLSAFSMQWALYAVRRNDQRNVVIALGLTVLFALAMANAEWAALGVKWGVRSHAYGTFYYLLYGYHLLHLLVAVPLLSLVAGRALGGHFSRESHETLRATASFWHGANAVWFLVVTALFILSRHG
jgi:cytochrome c oxidase subunit 3